MPLLNFTAKEINIIVQAIRLAMESGELQELVKVSEINVLRNKLQNVKDVQKMKFYVCYKSWDYEGCSIPLVAFDSEKKAKEWCEKEQGSLSSLDVTYEELEIE